uniref:Retinoblastoma 1 n=1 Tax=Sphaeramia orbicularis TaxID=375764 RepID=A0A673BTN1_9TELE
TISTKVNSALTRVEKKYDVMLALYQRFEKDREIVRSCWTMFLLAKGNALQMEDDLVISFQLLLCAVEFFIKRCPPDLLQPLYKSAISKVQSPPTRTSRRNQSKAKSRPPEPQVDLQLLETLCKENECNTEEVKNVYQTSFLAFLDSLDLSRSTDLPQVNSLNQQYNEHYLKSRDIDDRLFLDGDETILPPKIEIQRFSQAVGPRFIIIGKQVLKLRKHARLTTKYLLQLILVSVFVYNPLEIHPWCQTVLQSNGGNAEVDLCFPWILDVFSLAAFDFYKVIESFIKAEPTLSKDIVKHLETCENLIMEKIAWRTGSVLFELLKQEHEGGAAEQAEAPASFNQPLQHNHTAADLYLSPMHPGLRVLPPESPAPPNSQHASQPQNQPALQPGGQTPRHLKSNSLSLFYKKLYRLAYTRLKLLCSYLLSFNPELEPIIWTLFQHTLQHEYELMKNRHLDQLMMSAMYAICKVKSVDLRFKTIVTAYKNMPNTNQETFKHVLISDGHYDSIIVFYNQVFMQRLKTNILQYASPRPPTLSPIPQIPRSPYKFPNSPLRVPGSNNVYISPLKSPRMSPGIMTPRSRMLVSIGESFGLSNRFQKINQMVNSSDRSFKRTLDLGPTPKPLKRLRFDVDGQDEADGSKSGGDSTLIQKLAEMSKLQLNVHFVV